MSSIFSEYPARRFVRALMAFAFACTLISACDDDPRSPLAPSPGGNAPDSVSILALGDSYTIGEGVSEDQRWPALLADSLEAGGVPVKRVTYVAQTGWTTGALLTALDVLQTSTTRFDLVTVLIGVNNQFAQLDIADYPIEFEEILRRAIVFADGDTSRVVVLSIPDYGVTPVGSRFRDPAITAEQIDAYNAINRAIAADYGMSYVDVTPLSREAENDPTLVARDGLHYSGKMYARWVSRLLLTLEGWLRTPSSY